MLIDCLSSKRQVSMFESSTMILIDRLQNLPKFDSFSTRSFQWYDRIDFGFDSDIDWISKRSHSFNIRDSSMKVMSVTSISIRTKNLNIFSRLFKMISTVNDLKSNESSNMLMKQNMSISLSVTTLTRADRFPNSQQSRALESSRDSHMLYVLTSCIWSRVLS